MRRTTRARALTLRCFRHYKVSILKNRAAIAQRALPPQRVTRASRKNLNVSLDKALEVLSLFLGEKHGLKLADLSRRTGMHKSRVFRSKR